MSGEAARALLLGVGNVHRRDDGIGPALVRALAPRLARTHDCAVERGDDPVRLMSAWEGRRSVVVVDAALSPEAPGTLRRHRGVPAEVAAAGRTASTHGPGVCGAAALSRVLGTLPPSFVLVTVAGADFGHGEGLSPPLATRFPALLVALAAVLAGGDGVGKKLTPIKE